MSRLLQKINSIKKVIRLNTTGYYCPECTRVYGKENPTARFHSLYDEQYKKYKYYIKCCFCSKVTPGYENPKDAIDIWEDGFESIKILEVKQ